MKAIRNIISRTGTGNTNWQDEIFQTGFITNNNISITGASDKHSFYLGAGYAYEQGNIKHEKYSKITLNISNDYKVTDNFKVGFQFNGARMLPADSKSVATALRAAPVAEVYNKEYGLYTSLPGFQKAQMNNPMVDVELKANTTKAENYRGSGNIYGQWDFLQHFQFKAMFSLDYASNSTRTYTPIIKVYDASAEDDIATLGTGKTGVTQAKETEMKVQQMNRPYDSPHSFGRTYGEHRAFLELTDEEHFEVYRHAKSLGLDFVETLCSKGCLSLLKLFTPDRLKVASRDLTNLPLLEVMAETKIPIILSTGMAGRKELDDALEVARTLPD